MTENAPHEHRPVRQTIAAGASFAAGALLLTAALLTLLEGISAIVNDELLVIGPNYVYKFNTTTWGSIHIVIAILLGAVAIGLFMGAAWARVAAIVLAPLSIVVKLLVAAVLPGVVDRRDRAGHHRHLGHRHLGHLAIAYTTVILR